MNVLTFLFGAFLGLILTIGLLYYLYQKINIINHVKFGKISLPAFLLCAFLLFSYFKNWIPPVPLSMKYGAVYHHVKKHGDKYQLKFEKPRWYHWFKKSDRKYHYAVGDTVFCFVSIFAPTQLTKDCYHHWQQYFPKPGKWLPTDALGYKITGGRDGGYRGYTFKRNVSPGDWRVEVKTQDDAILGRIKFSIIAANAEHNRELKTIYQ
jgi:hypothetical protein